MDGSDEDSPDAFDAALAGIPEATGVQVECLGCGHRGLLSSDDARTRGEPLSRLTRRLLCSACGSRAVRASRTGTPRDVARLLSARGRAGRGQ